MASQCSKCGKRLSWLRGLDYTVCPACGAPPAPSGPPASPQAGGGAGDFLLGFGQVVSVLGCVSAPLYAVYALAAPEQPAGARVWAVAGAAAGFMYSAAMFVVFGRVRRLPPEKSDAAPDPPHDSGSGRP